MSGVSYAMLLLLSLSLLGGCMFRDSYGRNYGIGTSGSGYGSYSGP